MMYRILVAIGLIAFLFTGSGCGGYISHNSEMRHASGKTITGIVELRDNGVYIVVNYWSRSRVDYLVRGPLAEKIAGLSGMLVTLRGEVIRHGWSGSVYPYEILSVKRPPR